MKEGQWKYVSNVAETFFFSLRVNKDVLRPHQNMSQQQKPPVIQRVQPQLVLHNWFCRTSRLSCSNTGNSLPVRTTEHRGVTPAGNWTARAAAHHAWTGLVERSMQEWMGAGLSVGRWSWGGH